MNKYELTYKQTPRERYKSKMNDDVDDLIEAYPGIRLIDSSGGAMMTAESDAMVADQSFTVEGTNNNVVHLAAAIERKIDRPVKVEMR